MSQKRTSKNVISACGCFEVRLVLICDFYRQVFSLWEAIITVNVGYIKNQQCSYIVGLVKLRTSVKIVTLLNRIEMHFLSNYKLKF